MSPGRPVRLRGNWICCSLASTLFLFFFCFFHPSQAKAQLAFGSRGWSSRCDSNNDWLRPSAHPVIDPAHSGFLRPVAGKSSVDKLCGVRKPAAAGSITSAQGMEKNIAESDSEDRSQFAFGSGKSWADPSGREKKSPFWFFTFALQTNPSILTCHGILFFFFFFSSIHFHSPTYPLTLPAAWAVQLSSRRSGTVEANLQKIKSLNKNLFFNTVCGWKAARRQKVRLGFPAEGLASTAR